MSDFLDQVQLLLTTAWKPFLLSLAAVIGATWFITNKIYDREISTLKAERDSARSEVVDLKARAKPAAAPASEEEGPLVWFGRMNMDGGPALGRPVYALRFFGANRSKEPVKLKSAVIISGIDGTSSPLEVLVGNETLPVSDVSHIPPGAPIELLAKFGLPAPDQPGKVLGLEAVDFGKKWARFALRIEDEKRSYKMDIGEQFMSTFLPGIGPRVTKIAP